MTKKLTDIAGRFRRDGYAVLPSALPDEAIDSTRVTAAAVVDAFDVDAHRSTFGTGHRDTAHDRYFFESAEAVHCFLEEGAVDAEGRLNRPKALAINKIGHALQDRLPHYSAVNRSGRSRLAMTLHTTRAGTRWRETSWLQRPTLPAFYLDEG